MYYYHKRRKKEVLNIRHTKKEIGGEWEGEGLVIVKKQAHLNGM